MKKVFANNGCKHNIEKQNYTFIDNAELQWNKPVGRRMI
jgi:hypothetical protein